LQRRCCEICGFFAKLCFFFCFLFFGSDWLPGFDLSDGVDWDAMFNSFRNMGFQATSVGMAIEKINEMLRWRLSDELVANETDDDWKDPELRAKTKAKVFLGYTSNMISCGMRDYIRYLCKYKLVDVIVTTGGGIEEDFMKCMAPTFVTGKFDLVGSELRKQGLNRIGNLIIPNNNYCLFEEWIMPILDSMLEEQKVRLFVFCFFF
jgi:deoxyhypusine synthase